MSEPHLCIECQQDCTCDGYHMLTDCVSCDLCSGPVTPEDLGIATNDYDVVMPGDMLVDVDPGDEDDNGSW